MTPQWQYNPLAIPFVMSATIIILLFVLGWRRRGSELTRIYLWYMGCLLVWVLASLLELLTLNLELSLLFANISFLGITMFPVMTVGIVMIYNGQAARFRRLLPFMLIIPITTNVLIWTNPLHGLWRGASYRDLTTTWFPISYYEYGVWFNTVHTPFSIGMVFVAIYLLLRSPHLRDRAYRRQLLLLLAALLLPFLTEIAHQLGLQPIAYFNATSLVFPVSGVLIGWAVLDMRFLDISPIARDLVVENINDPVIVLDARQRIVDLNPAARHQLWPGMTGIIGQRIELLLPAYATLDTELLEFRSYEHEIEIEREDGCEHYEVKISPIERDAGQLLLLRNVTDQREATQVTIEQARQVAVLEERQRVARELHDSVNQTLFAASTLSDLMTMAIDRKPEKVSQYALDIQQLIRGATSEMRLILMELYPHALVETDLNISIQHLCTAFTGASGVPVTFTPTSQIHLEAERQVAFYRIAQEALQNINKHAEANEVNVSLNRDNRQLVMTIVDDGLGFDMDQTLTNHFGLMNMGKRAMMNGLKLSLNSALGEGTKVKLIGEE